MLVENIVVLGLALSLDAFGVAMGIGCGQKLKFKEKLSIIFSFGFFQGLFVLGGGILGCYINNHFFSFSGYFSGIIILLLGFLLLKEGLDNKEGCTYYNLDIWKYIFLGIGVSIDALGVGFSILYQYQLKLILINSLVVGGITFSLTFISLTIVEYIRNFALVERYSAYIGGIILILFGLKMII